MTELGLWDDDIKHKLIAHNGSIQVIQGAYNSGKHGKLSDFLIL